MIKPEHRDYNSAMFPDQYNEGLDEMEAYYQLIIHTNLNTARGAKKKHREGTQCQGEGCTGCHFYSGAISSLSELLGHPGIID